jgi:predicted PurR-regulated permease PerM
MSAVAIVYIIIISIIGLGVLFWFYREIKRSQNMVNWTEFNNSIVEWAKEIEDTNIRSEFLKERIRIITQIEPEMSRFNIEKEKEKIANKWGKHIPSLLQESRNKKLNKIL